MAYRGRLGRRGQAELLAVLAMALVLAVLVGAVVRFALLYRQASTQLEERAREVYQVVLSGGLRGYVDTSTNTVYLSSGVPLAVYAVYVHNGTAVLWGSLPAPPYPACAISQGPLLYLSNSYAPVYQGELARQVSTCSAWVAVVTDKGLFKWCPDYLPAGSGPGELLGEVYGISRLLPLLARYLDPLSYDTITSSYAPVAVALFNLTPSYRPYVSWGTGSSTRYCYDDLVYVRLTWDSANWYVTYRKCAADGPVLGMDTVPRSQTAVPYREWPYYSTCVVSSGVRYCFEVYAYASGRCDTRCDDPPNAWWAFEVGMKLVYRFEPVEPGYYVLVVMNRTTYENSFGRGIATCTFYHCTAMPGCVLCSTGRALCNYPSGSQVVSLLGGYRPVFWWDIRYDSHFEVHYQWDDGFEEGAWYPQTSVSSAFTVSGSYAYTLTESLVVSFWKTGLRLHQFSYYDYLRRYSTYQDGYYRVRFKLVFDEGGLSSDAKVWDYGVLVFLMRKL